MMYFLGLSAIFLIALFAVKNKQSEAKHASAPKAEKAKLSPSEAIEHGDTEKEIKLLQGAETAKEQQDVRTKIQNEATKLREKGDHRSAYKASMFLPPIKKGYQIFLQNMGVVGLGFRREAAIAFIDDLNQTIRLEHEPGNPQDENAIKVIGVGNSNEYFLGYLPKNAALQITKTKTLQYVYGRLVRAYRGTDDYLEIQLQIIGLKEKKKEFDAFAKNLPANDSQKEYLTFWGIAFSNQLTTEEAEKTISEHASKARQDALAWKEFTTFMNLLEEFEDKDQREYYGLKEVPREIVATAIKNMKAKLGSYQEVADDPEAIAECILQAQPNLALP